MISNITILRVTDNTGVRLIKSIKFYNKTLKSHIRVKDKLLGSVQDIRLRRKSKIKKLPKGTLKTAYLVRTKNPIRRIDGSLLKFHENAAILLDAKNRPMATRIIGALPVEFRKKKFFRIAFISGGTTL